MTPRLCCDAALSYCAAACGYCIAAIAYCAAAIRRRAAACALAAALLAGCVGEPPPQPMPRYDVTAFAALAQPVLAARCAVPSCHGRADRPLAVYAPRLHRADPARLYLDEPLTGDELEANARSAAAFALEPLQLGGSAESSLVLRKPLPVGDGGCEHAGGVVFAARADREWRSLREWVVTLSLPAEEAP